MPNHHWIIYNRVVPRVAVICLLLLTTLIVLFMPEPKLDTGLPISPDLPSVIDGWHGINIFFCQNEKCGATTTQISEAPPPSCAACKSTMKMSWSPAETHLLPKDTILSKKLYRQDDNEVMVTIVISGYENVSIHRPQMCLPGQGLSISSEKTITVPINNDHFRLRQLSLSYPKSPGLSGKYYYWFTDGEHFTESHWKRLAIQSWDRIVHGRATRWAYISIAPGPGNTSFSQNQLYAFLEPFIKSAVFK